MRKRNILARVIAVTLVGIITTPVLAKATLEPVALATPIPGPTLPAEAQNPPRGFLPANANPLGYSLTQIATAWTRWAFGTAAPNNPLLSVRCEQSTLNPRIWFLPPSIGTELHARFRKERFWRCRRRVTSARKRKAMAVLQVHCWPV